ncbi:BCCT family transporter [Methanosarcina sp. Mfa9]|uniref:BCCT family transporter n=1 Tax=Methanosarcina sp. Mfa9 TaxID=3439063 RepID=UPI003F84ACAC
MRINPVVFFVSASIVVLFVVLGAVFTEPAGLFFGMVQDFIVSYLGWFYILSVAIFLGFVLWLYVSPYGKVRLGKDEDRPEYKNSTWFAMLFSAGMGIGLLFYSVAEPIMHFSAPPEDPGGTVLAAKEAMNLTFFHWGLHAWAIYIIVGLSLAYFAYRHDLPLTIRSTFYPLLGEKIYGSLGDLVEIMAIFGTLFGVATSLGLGVMQINSGLTYLGFAESSIENQIWLIILITLAATASVVSGLDKGIRRLSQLNIGLGVLLLLFVLLTGPTVFLLSSFVESLGYYLQTLPALSFQTDAFKGVEWQKSWTMFYWGWWISWSPFVGMFIARVSRGRTIREFIRGVLVAPTFVTFLWVIIFGNTAIHMELFGPGGIVAAVSDSVPTALYAMLSQLPLGFLSSALATLVVATFFITSSDSGSLVIAILASNGEPTPPISQRIFWAFTQGAVAAVLLLTGGLVALQTAALTTALPFCVVMLFMCKSLLQGLRSESYALGLGENPPQSPDTITAETHPELSEAF